jgi:N-acetylglucosamine-6-sulfatase
MSGGRVYSSMRQGVRTASAGASAALSRRARAALLALGVALLAAGGALALVRDEASAAKKPRPNVVVIMTDDQTQKSISLLPNVERLIGDRGTTFKDSFVSFSLCCPSRATFLTGQYAHNHGVMGNSGSDGGFRHLDSSNTLPVWLEDDGYYTGHIGKYLNGYGRNDPLLVPDGWSEWHGSVDPSTYRYYGFTLNENGGLFTYTDKPQDYSTDLYTSKAVDFIQRRAPGKAPFFLWLAYLAPHSGGQDEIDPNPDASCNNSAKPAPRHEGAFAAEPLPRPPSFNEADVSDKPLDVRNRPSFDDATVGEITRLYRCRLGSLLAVNDGVKRVVDTLQASGELDNTLVVFTSDNGFMQGEHRIKNGKVKPYEESIRVPLMMRGPGIPAGRKVDDLAINPDLTRTILDETGVEPGLEPDGRSLLTFAKRPGKWHGRELLIETKTYTGIRTRRYTYVEHSTGERELYDLDNDPYELRSLHADPAYAPVMAALAKRLHKLADCDGKSCKRRPKLELRLRHGKGIAGGRSCAKRPISAAIGDKDHRKLVAVRYAVGKKKLGEDDRRPFDRRLPFHRFKGHRAKTAVSATADLLDGRRITLESRVRACR